MCIRDSTNIVNSRKIDLMKEANVVPGGSAKRMMIHHYAWSRQKETTAALAISGAEKKKDIERSFDVRALVKGQLVGIEDKQIQIKSTGRLQFVLFQRVDRKGSPWGLPTEQQFHDFINDLECDLIMSGAEMVGIMKGTAAGMETGTIEISTNDLDLLYTLLDFVLSLIHI